MNIEKMLDFMYKHHHKRSNVRYSMYTRYLNPNLDCSSAVYYALRAGGVVASNYRIGNTETLYKEPFLKEIKYKDVRRGDLFIQGVEGQTLGAGGHTGFFTRKGEIIHCNATNDGISTNNENEGYWWFLDNDYRPVRYFRIVDNSNKTNTKPQNKPSNKPILVKYENWHGTTTCACNVRSAPSTSAAIVATYGKGETIYYDRVYKANGYMWLSYIGNSGKRRYVAYRLASDVNSSWIIF